MKLKIGSLMGAVLATVCSVTVLAGKDDGVDVCHVTGSDSNPGVIITVSGNALVAHLAHGDSIYISGVCDGGEEHPPR